MKQILVIGNGESRKNTNLSLLKDSYTTVGCNAIHRDFTVDHLICCDQRMVVESVTNPNNSNTQIYTRSNWINTFKKFNNVKVVPPLPYSSNERWDDPWHWGSGPYAVLLGATLSNHISLIGFDLYGISGKVNNIYKGTSNYSKADSHSIDHSYWVHQISKVFQCFPDKYFTIYNDVQWAMPDSWKLNNVEFKNIDLLNIVV